MFVNKPKAPKAPPVPAGSKVTWVVKYQGGRKPFEDEREARRFAAEQRGTEKGWSEVILQIETVVVPR